MAKDNNVRNKANAQINKGAITSEVIDLVTLKRMYPKRFKDEIMDTEGYIEESFNKFRKKNVNGEQYPL